MFHFKFFVESKNTASLIPYNGFLVYLAVKRVLEEHAPWLLQDYLNEHPVLPFVVHRLVSLRKARSHHRRDEVFFQPGNRGVFGVTVFDKDNIFFDVFLSKIKTGQEFTIGEYSFSLLNTEFFPIKLDFFLDTSFVGNRAHVSFLSPTFFKRSSTALPVLFPYLHDVFSSLVQHWNTFHSHKVPDAFLPQINRDCVIRHYSLSLKKAPFSGIINLSGFVGYLEVSWKRTRLMQWVPVLLSYGQYVNIGSKRHQGFGEVNVNYF